MFNRFIGLIIIVFTFLLVRWFGRYQKSTLQRSPESQERALFKQRLPGWVKSIEGLTFLALLPLIFFGLFFASFGAHHLIHPGADWWHPSYIAGFLLTLPTLIIAVPMSMIMANIISYLVPPLRKANELAMAGLPAASFRQMNRGLILFLAWGAPFCLAALVLGVIDPWL